MSCAAAYQEKSDPRAFRGYHSNYKVYDLSPDVAHLPSRYFMNTSSPAARANVLITGDSEMADRIRAHNWAATPLGPIEELSETLVATVNLMLHSPFPTILSWGPEMVFLYNDAGIPTLMGKHPNALGRLYRDVFHEAWDLVSADLKGCFYRGETAVRDDMFIPIS
jgi:hypothetical protein